MAYYLAAEGGGSKLLAILYDENGKILGTEKMCGTNSLYHPAEVIETEMRDMIARLIPPKCEEIVRVDHALVGSGDVFLRVLAERVKMIQECGHGEGHVALAVTGEPYGIVAQAGTGSDAFLLQKDEDLVVGGWGPQLGDEGGGYDVGIMTIRAAIYGEDGRGPKTPLTELIKEHYQINHLWDLVTRFAGNPQMRQEAASATHALARAAQQKDPVALDIYTRAAHSMSNQVLTVIHRHHDTWEGPIVTSGGVWKGWETMFDVFCRDIWAQYPNAKVVFPPYEPIAGCISLGWLEDGYHPGQVRERLKENFGAFRIHTDHWEHKPYCGEV